MTAALVRRYDGAFVPTSHPELRRLELAAADGLCVLTWYARGVVRVHAAWEWPTRETMEHGPIVWP